jgi:hypothetical protein
MYLCNSAGFRDRDCTETEGLWADIDLSFCTLNSLVSRVTDEVRVSLLNTLLWTKLRVFCCASHKDQSSKLFSEHEPVSKTHFSSLNAIW